MAHVQGGIDVALRSGVPRRPRGITTGLVFHVVNRAARRLPLFDEPADYDAFVRVLASGVARFDVAVFAACVMCNHWHLVLSPRSEGVLSRFMHWVTTTHARRWHRARGSDGEGAVYQGRFKAIPVNADDHFLWVCRYVERNPLRAGLVGRAEDWPWSSLVMRENLLFGSWLSRWPIATPPDWNAHVNAPQTPAELDAFRRAVDSGDPFGPEPWRQAIGMMLGRRPPRARGRTRRRPRCPPQMTPDPVTGM